MNIQLEILPESMLDGDLADDQALADFHVQTAHWWFVDKMVEQPAPDLDPEPVSVLEREEILPAEPVLPKVVTVSMPAVTEIHYNMAQPYLAPVAVKDSTMRSGKRRARRGASRIRTESARACDLAINNSKPLPKSLCEVRLMSEGTLLKLRGNPELLLSIRGAKKELGLVLVSVLSGTFSVPRRTFIKVRRFETGSTEGMSKSELKLYNFLRRHIAV